MKARFKVGLLVGLAGLVLNICVSAAIGLCGPVVSLFVGAIAGYITGMQEKAETKSAGAQAGAISGLVAGGLTIIGQIIGGLGTLAYLQATGASLPFGTIPSQSAEISQQLVFYVSGLGTGVCFGLIGTVLSALAGAGTGYLGTPTPASEPL